MLTIDKTIKILNLLHKQGSSALHPDSLYALKLSIEALRRWKEGRQRHGWFYFPLLLGETK